MICCCRPVSPSVKICINSCHIHNFVSVCDSRLPRNSRRIPTINPQQCYAIQNSKRIPKECQKNSQRMPKIISKEFLKKIQIIKFFQKIPKEFSKIHKKFWLAIIGRNPFWACYISLKEWNSVHILSKILNEKTFLS